MMPTDPLPGFEPSDVRDVERDGGTTRAVLADLIGTADRRFVWWTDDGANHEIRVSAGRRPDVRQQIELFGRQRFDQEAHRRNAWRWLVETANSLGVYDTRDGMERLDPDVPPAEDRGARQDGRP